MLYILIVLLIALLFVYKRITNNKDLLLKDFNLRETLALRGLLAICVMLTHLCPYLIKDAPLLKDFCLWGPPSVATFFLLAGYGLAFSYKKKGKMYLRFFFKKRLSKLLWPLFFMTIIYQGYKAYKGYFNWQEMLWEPSPMSWFIYALIIWYLGYYFSFKVSKIRKVQLELIWGFTFIYLAITIYLKQYYFYISILSLPIAITYVFYEDKIKSIISIHAKIVWCTITTIVLAIMGYAVVGQYYIKLPGWSIPVNIIVPWAIVYITYYMGGWKNKFTNFIGEISYEFYIVHGFIIILLGDCNLLRMTGYINAISIIILVFGLTVITAYIISNLCSYITKII